VLIGLKKDFFATATSQKKAKAVSKNTNTNHVIDLEAKRLLTRIGGFKGGISEIPSENLLRSTEFSSFFWVSCLFAALGLFLLPF
jgi:hypothetical protein